MKNSKLKFSKYEKRIPKSIDSDAAQGLFNYAGSTKDKHPIIPYLDIITKEPESPDQMGTVSVSVNSKSFQHETIRAEDISFEIIKNLQNRIRKYGQETFEEFKAENTKWTPRIDGLIKTKREVTFKENWFQWILNRFKKKDNRFTIEETKDISKEMDPLTVRSMMLRKLATKILEASNYLYYKNRRGAANAMIVNGRMASLITDFAGYSINPSDTAIKVDPNNMPQLYNIGTLYGIQIWVDPYRQWNDTAITIVRVDQRDAPGFFLSYNTGSIAKQTIAEGTMRPKTLNKADIAIVELGFNIKYNYIEIDLEIPENLF